MIRHQITLDYALNPGWLGPFVTGLLQGQAIARRCAACAATSFPPVRTCACGSDAGEWVTLPGTATITLRTTGQDGDFALVSFDGATTQSTVKLVDVAADASGGHIIASTGGQPGLCLGARGARNAR